MNSPRRTPQVTGVRGGVFGRMRRATAMIAAGLALVLISPLISAVPAVLAADLVPVVIDLSKTTIAPAGGVAAVAGDPVHFEFTITCSSTQTDCVNLTLTDTFPDPIIFDSVNASTSFTTASIPNGFIATFTQPLDEGGVGLVAGESVTFQAVGYVDPDVDASFDGVTVTNTTYAVVDNPDSNNSDSSDVLIEAPLVISSTITKTVTPNSFKAFPATPVAFALGAENTSNTSVDTLTIQDPIDPIGTPSTAFDHLEVTSLSGVTFPSGANRVRVDYFNGAAWVTGTAAATAVLPAVALSTIKGLRFTFSNSNPAVDIARGATAAVTINTQTTADVAAFTTPFSSINIATSQAVLGTDLGTIVGANAPFTINPAAIAPEATKTFSTHDILGGEDLSATLVARNGQDFALTSLSITEPQTATPDLNEQGLEFLGWNNAAVIWPAGATAMEVTYYRGTPGVADVPISWTLAQSQADSGAVRIPPPSPATGVTGFSVVFTGNLPVGANATLVMNLRTDEIADADPDISSTNTIRVDATTATASATTTASDSLVRRNSRLNTTITKLFTPHEIYASAGSAAILSLPAAIDPIPSGPGDAGGSTVGATEFVVTEADQEFFNAFNATGILATDVPVGSTMMIYYSTDGGVTYPHTLAGPVASGTRYSGSISPIVYEALNGLQFVFTPVIGTLPPGFNVQPNIKVQVRATDRTTGDPVLDVSADIGVPLPAPLVIDNLADVVVTNTIVNRTATDDDNDIITLNPLRPGTGPGYNMITKAWQENDPPLSTVTARSQDSRYATISWGTGAEEYDSVVISDTPDDSTTEVDNLALDPIDTVYDAFDLVSIPAINSNRDPLIRYDAVSNVEYLSATTNTWVAVPGNPCAGTACYGKLPTINLSDAVSADTIGIRLTYIENPDRAAAIATADALPESDPLHIPAYLAPEVGSGVAMTRGVERGIRLVFELRDTLRSDPTEPVLGATRGAIYNNGNPGVVDNSARIEGRENPTTIVYADEATDDILILDTPINVSATKDWIDGPLGIPPVGTAADLFPTALMTVTGTNDSLVTVDELRIDEPTNLTVLANSPFDYLTITKLEKQDLSDTTSMVTLLYFGGTTSAPMTIDAAVALAPAALANVIGFRMTQDRVDAGESIGLRLHTQLREQIRGTTTLVTPMTVPNTVMASVRDPGGTTDPATTTHGEPPLNVEIGEASAQLEIEAWEYGVEVTKEIAATTTEFGTSTSTSSKGTSAFGGNPAVVGTATTPAIQYDNDEASASQAVVTLAAQPVGNVRTTEMVLEDISPSFWNAYDLVSLDTSDLLNDARKQVRVDVLLGEGVWGGVAYGVTPAVAPLRDIAATCAGDTDLSACWVTGHNAATLEFPTTADGMPAGATVASIRGIRFTITNIDGSAWERAYNPVITTRFTVDRRANFVAPSGEEVPSTLSTYIVPAPGETEIGTFTDDVTVIAGAPLWSATASTSAEVKYQHLPARVKIKQSPEGAQSLGVDIPYKIAVTNTGGAFDKVLTGVVVTDRLPIDELPDPDLQQLVQGEDPNTGMPYDLSDLISYRLADASNVTQAMPATPVDVQFLAADGDHRDLVFTFPNDFVLPRGWTVTITLNLQFRPNLDAGTPVPTVATVVTDQLFDTCEWFVDNSITAETPRTATDSCYSPTEVRPLASAPITIVKGVRGVDAGPLDASGVPIEESAGNPFDDLGILKTVPASSVSCDAPNVSVDTGPAEFFRYPCVPITRPGSIEEWAATFTNGGNIGLTKLVAIDVLPAPGDTGVIVNEDRGSKWTPTLRSYPTVLGLPTGATFEVFYLTDRDVASQRCNGADIQNEMGMTPSTNPAMVTGYQTCYTSTTEDDDLANRNWQVLPVLPLDDPLYATVVAMKFIMTATGTTDAEVLSPADRLAITYQSRTAAVIEVPETGPAIDNQSVAYNSIAGSGSGFDPDNGGSTVPNRFVIEPRKVGVAMATGSVELRKTVTGAAASYSQSNFDILLTCTSAGVSIPVVSTAVPKNAAVATVAHGLPLYADCVVTEDTGYNSTTTTITPSSVIAQAPQTAGLEEIHDPNPVFGVTRPSVELSTVTNDYAVTTVTISKTIDTNGALNGEGGTAIAVTPSDLRFSINCTFNNGATTVTVFNQSNISLDHGESFTTPASPGIPVGSVCTVTETNSRTANSTTSIVTANGVTNPTPDNATVTGLVLGTGTNSVAFTNVYNVASLAITKVVNGSWYTAPVAGGEQAHTVSSFTVNLVCTRQLDGTAPRETTYTASVVLDPNVVGGLTHTFENIMAGSNCTLTEPDNSGATSVAFTSSASINNISGAATRTITNTFTSRDLAITKTVATNALDGAGDVVYLDAPYTIQVACTFDGGSVYPAGYTSDAVLVFTEADLGNAKTATKTLTGLPSGAECSVTETSATPDATDVTVGWVGTTSSSVSAKTATFTLSSSVANSATVTNYYGVEHFTVVKSLQGGASAQFGVGPYVMHVYCFVTVDVGGVPTAMTSYDGDITLPLAGGEMSYSIDTLADGSVCSVEETNFASTGADAYVYKDGSGTVIDDPAGYPTGIAASGTDPRVVVENWYLTGAVTVSKTLLGDGAGAYGAGPFEVTLSCVRDSVAVTLTDPVRTFDPTAVPAEMSTTFTGLPTGAECTLTETDTGSATESSIDDGTTTVTDVAAGFTFTVSTVTAGLLDNQAQPALEVTNSFALAGLTVTKHVTATAEDQDGTAIDFGPFPITVSCTFQGVDVFATGYSLATPMTKSLEAEESWSLEGLPAGADCDVTEDDDMDAAGTSNLTVAGSAAGVASTGTTVSLVLGELGTTNSVDFTNFYDVGSIDLSKVVDGLGRTAWGTATFEITVTCVLTDATHPGGEVVWDEDYSFTSSTTDAVEIRNLATGAVCTITETNTGSATATVIEVDSTPTTATSVILTVGNDVDPVEVVVTNTFDLTEIDVTKQRTGAGRILYGSGPFEVTLTCDFDGAAITIPGGATRELTQANAFYNTYTGLPVGADCAVSETETGGADSVVISDETLTTTAGAYDVTITNDFELGELSVDKSITGVGSFLYATTDFEVTLTCEREFNGAMIPVDIPGGATRVMSATITTVTYTDLPARADCEVTESKKGYASTSTVDAPVAIPAGGTETINVVNDFQLARMALTKQSLGLYAASHEGETYRVTVECVQDVDGTPTTIPITDGATRDIRAGETTVFEDIPVPAECSFDETYDGGANLKIWTAASVPLVGGKITASDGDTDMQLANMFVLAATGADLSVWVILAALSLTAGTALIVVGQRNRRRA